MCDRGHSVESLVGQEMSGGDHQTGRFERVAATERIERVLKVVGAGGDIGPGSSQGGDCRHGPWRGSWMVAPLKEQIGLRESDDADASVGDQSSHSILDVDVLYSEAHAVAGGHRELESFRDDFSGEILERQHGRVEGFVDVEVETDASRRRDLEEHRIRSRGIVVEMRTATHQIGSGVEGRGEQGTIVDAAPTGHRPTGEGDDLDLDGPPEPRFDLDEGLDGSKTLFGGGVSVAADDRDTVRDEKSRRPLCSLDDVGRREGRRHTLHGADGAHEVTSRIVDSFGEKGLVEMGMGLSEGRENQVASEIDHVLVVTVGGRSDSDDPVAVEAYIDRRTIGSGGAGEQHLSQR